MANFPYARDSVFHSKSPTDFLTNETAFSVTETQNKKICSHILYIFCIVC